MEITRNILKVKGEDFGEASKALDTIKSSESLQFSRYKLNVFPKKKKRNRKNLYNRQLSRIRRLLL